MNEEYLDVLDEAGNLTQEVKSRKQVHMDGLWHLVCHGHCSAGDSSLTTAQKELEEELGIKLDPSKFEKLFRTKKASILNDGKYINKEWIDVYLVELDVDLSSLILQESEVSAVKWISCRDLVKAFQSNDSAFVPCHTTGPYGQLFEIIQKRYPTKN